MIESKDITAVGRFQKTHALKGELNVLLDIDAEYFEEGNAAIVELDGIYVPFFTESVRPKGSSSWLIKLEGVDSEQEARKFVNLTVYAEKGKLAEFLGMEDEEILDEDDLVGYEIHDNFTGSLVGIIKAIDTSTQNMLFIVETPQGEDVYIPAVDEFITEIDDDNRRIWMNLPEGLIDLNMKTDKNE